MTDLRLRGSKIHKIEEDAFFGLGNLTGLILGANQLLSSEIQGKFSSLGDLEGLDLGDNCLDISQFSPEEFTYLDDKATSSIWTGQQYACIAVDYVPPTRTTGTVEASFSLQGDPTRLTAFLTANPTLTTELATHTFTENGSYNMDLSSVSATENLRSTQMTGQVDRIYTPDHCPNGDYSGSDRDGECDAAPVVTPPSRSSS